jgi:hypothetical protein
MPIDRIQCFGIQLANTELAVFKAGKIKYRAKEEKWETQLIDGEFVEGKLWLHLNFDLLLMYLDQQLTGDDIPDSITADDDFAMITFSDSVGLKSVLDDIRNAEASPIYFFPKLLDQAGTVDDTKYRVLGDKDTIDLIDARENGRFNMYTPISLKTKTPLTAYPFWINR